MLISAALKQRSISPREPVWADVRPCTVCQGRRLSNAICMPEDCLSLTISNDRQPLFDETFLAEVRVLHHTSVRSDISVLREHCLPDRRCRCKGRDSAVEVRAPL